MVTTPVVHAAAAGHAALASPAALGGGGLAHVILRLLIWRMIWRFGLLIWHIPAVGPGVFLVIVAGLAGLAIFRSRRGRGWAGGRRTRYTSDGIRPEPGPRDW
jgi:hypothetical protein